MVFGLADRGLRDLKEKQKTGLESGASIQASLDVSQLAVSTSIDTKISNPEILGHREPYLTAQKIHVVYVTEKSEADIAISQLLLSKGCLGLDIETYGLPEFIDDKDKGLSPRKSAIRLVQLYDGSKTVFVFDLIKLGGLSALGDAIWGKAMVAHNAIFELKHLLHNGVNPKRLGCSMLADRVLTGNRAELREDLGLAKTASLKDVAEELLGIEVSKEMQTSDWATSELSEEQIDYAALDAVLARKIFEKQYSMLESRELVRVYNVLRDAMPFVGMMELTGICFNVAKHLQLIAQWKEESEALRDEILRTIGQELNLNSGKQLGAWLEEVLKEKDLEAWAKTAKGKLSTSTPSFKLHEHMNDLFPKLVQYRHAAKRISSFGKNLYEFIDMENSRLYGSFSLGTTSTGRMASHKPNMQNMPRKGFRDLFCAKDGFVLVSFDYSQQELRVAGLITGDRELLRVYESAGDIHTNTAASLLNIPRENVSKEQRQLAKAVIFGLLYGQGAKGLVVYAKQQYGVELTEEEATKHRKRFFKLYEGLRRWQINTGKVAELTGKVKTPCGRVRDFNREKHGYRYTAALNLPIQGAAAEITLHALGRLRNLICDDCRLVNVIHDEILLEVREDLASEYSEMVKHEMTQAFLDVFPGCEKYLKGLVEAKIGKNWAEAK